MFLLQVGNMKGDIEGVKRKVQAEKAAAQEWGSLIKEEEGEETVLIKKVDANKEAIQEMEMTQKRLTDILSEITTQVDAMMATIEVRFFRLMAVQTGIHRVGGPRFSIFPMIGTLFSVQKTLYSPQSYWEFPPSRVAGL